MERQLRHGWAGFCLIFRQPHGPRGSGKRVFLASFGAARWAPRGWFAGRFMPQFVAMAGMFRPRVLAPVRGPQLPLIRPQIWAHPFCPTPPQNSPLINYEPTPLKSQ